MGWFRKALNREFRDETIKDFRTVLGSPRGKKVLTKILSDLCFFREDLDDEETVLNNYAKQLLSYFGTWEEGNEIRLVDKLLEVTSVRSDDGSGDAT